MRRLAHILGEILAGLLLLGTIAMFYLIAAAEHAERMGF